MEKNGKLYNKKLDWNRSAKQKTGASGAEPYREEPRRDFARLIHCPSFRRLQGKTQLFPSHESDFFRNRLTHSLEVAQIAKSIAIRANHVNEFFKKNRISTDVVEFAGLAHDLGHPPFGHNGEKTLDSLMLNCGGFEGNAQTLRLLTKIEKKATQEFPNQSTQASVVNNTGKDIRLGLNITSRCLASILKYDKQIPESEEKRQEAGTTKKPMKGYYALEKDVVEAVKLNVAPGYQGDFKTIECSIMDVADDIAYSTYDLEDAMKGEFLTPLTMIAMDDSFKSVIVSKVKGSLDEKYKDLDESDRAFSVGQLNVILGNLFEVLLTPNESVLQRFSSPIDVADASYLLSSHTYRVSDDLCKNGYFRTSFTSALVGQFVRQVEFKPNFSHPSMSSVRLSLDTFKKVETLKHFAYELLISSPRLKIAEKRGDQIIRKLFQDLRSDKNLLPNDWRHLFGVIDNGQWQDRVVCDYIAGMTDRYCVEMYARLTSTNPISIWKPF